MFGYACLHVHVITGGWSKSRDHTKEDIEAAFLPASCALAGDGKALSNA